MSNDGVESEELDVEKELGGTAGCWSSSKAVAH